MKFSRFLVLFCIAMASAGCGTKSPFRYRTVSGQVLYDDGALLPLPELVINFHPQVPPANGGKFAGVGSAIVDPKTGKFSNAVSVRGQAGLVCVKHKVTLHLPGRQPLPPHIASADYSSPEQTPLEIGSDDSYADIRVKRPE